MIRVVVPVRYPLSNRSQSTLAEAVRIADEREAFLTVLHINQYRDNRQVTRSQLRTEVESAFGELARTRYAVRKGLFVEEAILEEVAAEEADIVVIGKKQAGKWRRALRRLVGDPDIQAFLAEHLDCDLVTVSVD